MNSTTTIEITDSTKFQEIIAIVTAHTGIDPQLLKKKIRKAPIPYTKQLITWCAVKTIDINITNEMIIDNMGWKDHSGPITAFKKIKGFLDSKDDKVVKDIDTILEKIKNNDLITIAKINCKKYGSSNG